MAITGGFCPLPMRLNDDPIYGWSAAQYSRLCSDTLAASRSLPFAKLSIARTAGGACRIVAWHCRAPETVDNTPTVSGTNQITITFPVAPEDEAENKHPLKIYKIEAQALNGLPVYEAITAPNIVTVSPDATGVIFFTAYVYADWNVSTLASYGAALDKEDTRTEQTPYAWIWYQELGASLGSAFGKSSTGLVHAKKIAIARAIAAVSRHEEQIRNQSTPHTAAPKFVEKWAQACLVPAPASDPEHKTRTATAAKFASRSGQDLIALESALYDLLGSRYVGIRVFTDADPDGTWPDTWDLGAGVWASTRAKILVDVLGPANASDLEFNRLMGVQFVQLMDQLTPAWVWFDWTNSDSGGFYLDVSPLDFTGF